MKAKFFALAALVLGMASCQQDFAPEANVGGEVDFTLRVSAPELAATRAGEHGEDDSTNGHNSAYGAIDYLSDADWDKADLRYILEVYDYDESGVYADAQPIKDRQVKIVDKYEAVSFELRLVHNRKYHFVVFADFVDPEKATETATFAAQENIGLHHVIGATLADIQVKNDGINNEFTDAYFGSVDFTPSNKTANTADPIVLTRPYAKVRVVATDLAELNYNVDPGKVIVKYNSDYCLGFNAVNGDINTEETEVTYEYDYAKSVSKKSLADHYYTEDYDARTEPNVEGTELHSHMTLFTDYILATNTQETIQFTMTVNDKDGEPIKITDFNTQIPVQRNHLTTIIGNVLTTATEVNVSINDNFAGYYNPEIIFVGNAEQLQEALDNLVDGQLILLENDIKGNFTILQKEGVNVVISGCGYQLDGNITINGDARAKGAETILLEDINFYTENDNVDFIYAPTKINGRYNYSHNITVDNCTFTSANYNESVVGIKLQTTYNAVVKNSSAKNLHSFVQIKSTDNEAIFDNIKVENCKNGLALGNIAKATIKNVEIATAGYGIRLDGEKTRTVAATIENANISAYIPVNVREMDDAACNVDVEFLGQNNVLAGSVYEIVFCSNDYEDGVAPAAPMGTFRLQNAEESRAYYGDVNSFSAFDAAVNSTIGDVVVAESNITNDGIGVEVERDVVLDFANYEFNAGSNANSKWYALEIKGKYNVTIENANFTRAGISASDNANVVFKNGTIDHNPGRTGRYIFCATGENTVITIKDGSFKNNAQKNKFFWANDNATIYVEGGTFNGTKSNMPIYLSGDGKVIITGGTFNFDPTEWVADGYVVKAVGKTWVVSPDVVENADELVKALKEAAEGDKINLKEGVDYGTITAGELKNVTINGAEGAAMIFNTDADSKLENVTLNSVNFAYDGTTTNFGVVINADAQIENLVLDGCSFVGTGAKAGRGIYGQNPNATITVKNCHFANMGYPIYTMAAGGYASLVVEDCTFELIKSWAIMPQYNDYLGDLTINNCSFVNCTGGLVKAGKFTAGHTFTFTNNTITNSSEHSAKNWFTIDTTAASKVVENNTKDGAAWAPADAEGLK